MCKEFSGPSSCCFSGSHKLCCTGRGGALICSWILWGSICAEWCCRGHEGGVKYIPKPEQPRWDYFREGSGCSSLAGRRVFAWPSVMAHVSCDAQELRVGHPRSRLWQRAQLWVASLESRKPALMERSWTQLPAAVLQHPPAVAHDAICAWTSVFTSCR